MVMIFAEIVYMKYTKMSNTIYSLNAFLNLEIEVTKTIR